MQIDQVKLEELTVKLYNYCLSLTSSKWEAEDLVQETLIKYIKLKQDDPDKEMNESFLFTMARNLLIDGKRKQKETFTDQAELIATIDQSYEWDSLLEILCSVLPLHQAMLVTLKDVFQYTSQEIADMFRVSNESIKTSLHRSRQKLNTNKDFIIKGHNQPDLVLFKKFTEAVKMQSPFKIFKYYRLLDTKNYKIFKDRYQRVIFISDPNGNILQILS
ncbi:RNA polymerase sigma factor [Filobacillus milosensis]|uniref:RNA polymerase sigma factor n=1 Tax=Filobacillus milosensis TaxID=94137 RepID=A0A4Y8INM7_9BACI|nr:RNA polymerase sigma factor [Filobacillus milosensis]TFB22120.1 RNA polymerase sigma factor [Filobacillus milosensis]